MAEHEASCQYVSETCPRCRELVPRKDKEEHDCVQSMLARYQKKSMELTELSKQVDEITQDINKQTTILDRLNQINNEKSKRITEIERYLNMKKGMTRGSAQPQNYVNPYRTTSNYSQQNS